MIKLNISEAKTHLSRYLPRLAKGELIVLCKHNVPIAEIRGLPAHRSKKRPIGLAKGTARLPDAFFAPLPAEIEAAFNAEDS